MNDILVSIAVITYGHEKYIKQALDSILMQDVNFNYEIIVGEDCSPDNTRKILLEYQNKYPNIFILRLNNKNIGSTKNLYDVFMHCKGKYITLLEGDDYWIDSLKLKKQVEFLNNESSYIGVGCTTKNIDEDDNTIAINYGKSFPGEDFSMDLFFKGYTFVCVTIMFKNIFLDKDKNYNILWEANRLVGDTTINMLLLDLGSIRVLDECMFLHRVRSKEGELNYNSIVDIKKRMTDQIQVLKANDKYFNGKYNFEYKYISKFIPFFIYCFKRKQMKDFMLEFKDITTKTKFKFWLALPVEIAKLTIKKLFRMPKENI